MGTVEISVFVLRLAALFVWIQTILQVSYLPMILFASDANLGRASSIGYAISLALHALLGTTLWVGSRPLARRLLGEPSTQDLPRAAAIAGLGFVLAGIFVIDAALEQTWGVVFESTLSSAAGDPSRFWAASASLAVLLILGLTLVVGGRKLATRMFPSGDPGRTLAHEIQAVAFSILGIMIAVRALPTVLTIAADAGWFQTGDSVFTTQSVPWPAIGAGFLRLVIGVALFLGGGALSRAWRWTQTAVLNGGRRPSDVPRP